MGYALGMNEEKQRQIIAMSNSHLKHSIGRIRDEVFWLDTWISGCPKKRRGELVGTREEVKKLSDLVDELLNKWQ